MRRVLVLTREFRGVPMGYANEFKKRGCEVRIITSEVYCSKWNILFRLKNLIGLSNARYMERKDRKFGDYISNVCKEFNPDIIYVCHGTQLRAGILDQLTEKYFVVADLIDRLEFFPALYDCIGHYDAVYTYLKEDCELLKSKGINCKYLPAIGNPDVFYPMNIVKDIDICFVGAMYPAKYYGDRIEIIDKLIKDFPNANIFVGGACAPLRRPIKFLRWLMDEKKRKIYNNRDITSYECNEIYNRSKICLNINRLNTGDGWSERLGNIMLTGAFQIVTFNESIVNTFPDMIETFLDYDDLKNKISYYLSNYDELTKKAHTAHIMYLEILESMKKELDVVADIIVESENKVYGECLNAKKNI